MKEYQTSKEVSASLMQAPSVETTNVRISFIMKRLRLRLNTVPGPVQFLGHWFSLLRLSPGMRISLMGKIQIAIAEVKKVGWWKIRIYIESCCS